MYESYFKSVVIYYVSIKHPKNRLESHIRKQSRVQSDYSQDYIKETAIFSFFIQIFQKLNPNPNSSGIKYTKVCMIAVIFREVKP